jgi:hypothetical protein
MRPAARLRAVVVLPVLLIMMASATVAAAMARTHTCAPSRHPAVTETRWATCTASGVVVQGPHSTGRNPATGHKPPNS